MGMVAETSEVKLRTESGLVPVNIRGEAFFGVTCTADRRRGYDYLTTYAKTTLPSVPTSFKGVSGGGLWQIGLSMKKATGVISWAGEHHFRGVAFWEDALAELRRENARLIHALAPADLERVANHPEYGLVTVSMLLNLWTAHDLQHTVQAEEALMQVFIPGTGHWRWEFTDHDVEVRA